MRGSAGLVACLLAVLGSGEALAATIVDLTPGAGSSGSINGVGFAFATQRPAGTGILDPFVRIQANPQEQGYNTSNPSPPFDELPPAGGFTRDLLFGDLFDLDGNFLFVLDINESANGRNALLSIDELQIYISSQGGQNTTDLASLGTLIYDLDAGDDGTVLLDYRNAEGSGVSDMHMTVPGSLFAGVQPEDFVILFSRFGDTERSGAGFEEWAVLVPEPGSASLLALGLAALGVVVGRNGRGRRGAR